MNSYRIIDFRKKRNLTCSDLAKILDVHKAQVTRWELGKQRIPNWLGRFLDCLERSEETRQ